MGGHGGLNILPQKRWNVYNYDNREKVKQDEEAAAKEEQLKREQSRKRDAEFRLDLLRKARGIAPPPQPQSTADATESVPLVEAEPQLGFDSKMESESRHINLFEGIRIFDPVVVEKKGGEEDRRNKRKKAKVEEVSVVGPEEEKYRLGYGVAGKGVKAPWYMMKKRSGDEDEVERESVERERSGGGMKKKKTVAELREERLKREKKEKERERALLTEKLQWSGVGLRDGVHRRSVLKVLGEFILHVL
ncbi:hypothetical protein AKJ16_DCAP20975 [Drosera capensis]